ncbi:MAG: hypothetical protein JWM87_3588 [Candidatus Eremiobacteraeota bacterium]|nr:hypothetical protein [Candidatus Eremiobacteraeota bacterium]
MPAWVCRPARNTGLGEVRTPDRNLAPNRSSPEVPPVNERPRFTSVRVLTMGAALLWLSACGGGGGSAGSSVAPGAPGVPVPPPRSPSNVTISGTLNGTGPYVLAKRRANAARRTSSGFSFDHIQVDGTLYTADAASYTLKNSTTIPAPSNNVYAASVSFSNVPSGNNQWALLTFTGVASDGSKIALGELGGLIDVGGSSTNTAALNASTTLSLQLFGTMLGSGLITPYDIDNTANLSDVLASTIQSSGVAPNAQTGVFDAGGLQQVYNFAAPLFQRQMTVSTSPGTPGNVVLVRDYTNTAELNVENNLETFLGDIGLPPLDTPNAGSFLLRISGVLGFDLKCGGFGVSKGQLRTAGVPLRPVPSVVRSCSVPNPTGSVNLRNVYGGNLMVGATNDPYDGNPWTPPFTGGWTTAAPRAASQALPNISVPTASTQLAVTIDDPYYAAFPLSVAPFGVYPLFGTGPLSATDFGAVKFSPIDPFRYVESGFSGTQETVLIDTFNPWNVPVADLALCDQPVPLFVGMVLPSCFQLNAAQPFNILRPFTDDGTNLGYYNWAVGGAGGTIAPDGSGTGYDVVPAGAGTVTLTTTTPTALFARSQVEIINELPLGTVWTVTVVGAANSTRTNTGVNVACSCGKTAAIVELDDVGNTKTIKSFTLSVNPGNTPFLIGPIYADPTGTSIATVARRLAANRHRAPQNRR